MFLSKQVLRGGGGETETDRQTDRQTDRNPGSITETTTTTTKNTIRPKHFGEKRINWMYAYK